MLNRLWRTLICETVEMHLPSPDSTTAAIAHCTLCDRRIRRDQHGRWYCDKTRDAMAIAKVIVVTASMLVVTSVVFFLV